MELVWTRWEHGLYVIDRAWLAQLDQFKKKQRPVDYPFPGVGQDSGCRTLAHLAAVGFMSHLDRKFFMLFKVVKLI